ncbi:unnamed protein product [Dibothriocephalus latus]|uniref:Uncharacterized protein n=1 Tax=Dibothriocephalus latus TaxID=60516 RepID=A0A3P7P4M9_DIBLA|nr:unnamed protein product [Dibothriocephalus latus]
MLRRLPQMLLLLLRRLPSTLTLTLQTRLVSRLRHQKTQKVISQQTRTQSLPER